tara:strand:+ start:446 stop:748 length:303 start_codon:yes stop_codon:yes gene_type:complete
MVIQVHMEAELLQHLEDSGLLVVAVLDLILQEVMDMVELVEVDKDKKLLIRALLQTFQQTQMQLKTPEVVEVDKVELVVMDQQVVLVVLVLLLFIMTPDK